MNFKEFLSSIGFGTMKIDTVIERPQLEEGETLNGTIYVYGGESDMEIDYIELQVIKMIEDYREDSDFNYIEIPVTKQSLELAGNIQSKETKMQHFEIVPDERWLIENEKAKLVVRTVLHIKHGFDVQDEDEITYG
ncbi:sporulation protein [Planococcus salinus]|uniref:Stage 0 sporulation protein M n=1 Tax=Planococcus salinus TaxID=1848460 RepID=A0A3M8P9N4_9BACL|nr:sporulation protein [Planococcus salinus]RNF40415.1 stage 0 sporulation protein M [Planococcus salinus]